MAPLITHPKTVNKSFLTPGEIQYVKSSLHEIENLWFTINNTTLVNHKSHTENVNPANHRANYFGPSLYSMISDEEHLLHYKRVVMKYNDVLQYYFSDIIDRIKREIELTLSVPCEFREGTSLPGFHIFGPGFNDRQVKYDYFYNHIDSFPGKGLMIGGIAEVYSFIIPIQNPKSGACLEYTIGNEVHKFPYTEGEMSYWPGKMQHRIGHFDLSGDDDYRITWQMHVAVQRGQGYIFW
jgi:hypothetical protein